MANTYSQIYIQVVFAVQGRPNLIQKQNKEELHKYMTGIVRERDQKLLAIHCMPDHTHMLLGLKPSIALTGASGHPYGVWQVLWGGGCYKQVTPNGVSRFGGPGARGHSAITRG